VRLDCPGPCPTLEPRDARPLVRWFVSIARDGSSLSLTVAKDQASCTRNQSVWITAVETSGGSPMPNTTVTFTVTKANGAAVTKSATTSATGEAVFKSRTELIAYRKEKGIA